MKVMNLGLQDAGFSFHLFHLLHGWPRLRPSFLQESEESLILKQRIFINSSLSLCVCLQDRMQIKSANSQRAESASQYFTFSERLGHLVSIWLVELVKSLNKTHQQKTLNKCQWYWIQSLRAYKTSSDFWKNDSSMAVPFPNQERHIFLHCELTFNVKRFSPK